MNYQTVLIWAFALLFFVLFLFELRKENPSQTTVRQIAYDAVFLSIILIMGFVPQMGYIAVVPGLSLTLMHLPVLLGAYLFGWKRGLLYGFFFGFTSWMQALSSPIGFNAFFVVPWVSLLPRVLFGFLSGFFFKLLKNNPKISRNVCVVGAIAMALTLIHTFLVFGALFIFDFREMTAFFASKEIVASALKLTFGGVILLGAIGESTLAALLTPLLGKISLHLVERKK